jgi:DNA-binding MarR family transcriptional regulator
MDLRELEGALAAFAVLSPTSFPIHHAQVFLVVAARGHVTYQEIEEALNLTNSTVSRTVNALGETHRKGYPGLDLLEVYRDPEEGRRYLVRLTAKGKALLRQLQRG